MPTSGSVNVTATTGSIGINVDLDGLTKLYPGSGEVYLPTGCTNVTISGQYNSVNYNSSTGLAEYTLYGPMALRVVSATITWEL